ncbi:MAG: alpha/beta fold hydrolase [Gammaproteobacteria bacterium]|nr:alpha/beta fold hydrolase [Gammaproteobacteria bacterium]
MTNTPKATLPSNFFDALIAYAIDPLQWEALVQELRKRDDFFDQFEPNEFLAVLSKAESLAWQLRNENYPSKSHWICLFIDEQQNLTSHHTDLTAANDFCLIQEGQINFCSERSLQNLDKAITTLEEFSVRQVLVELHSLDHRIRYGYLARAADLPAGLQPNDNSVRYGLLIAQAQPMDQTRHILQSSFRLTTAETAVCQHLSSGLQLKEVAQALGISANTARNHLQSVFEKTHTNRQNDLLLLITQLDVILAVIADYSQHETPALPSSAYPAYQFSLCSTGSKLPRRIAYRCYGDGANYVFYFHENAGTSRLPPNTDTLASKYNLTIVAAERPGSGFSDPLEGYGFADIAQEMVTLADNLGVDQISTLGFLSGGAHALTTSALMQDRIKHVMLVAARPPNLYYVDESSPLAVLRRNLTQHPWLISAFFNILRNRINTDISHGILTKIYGSVEKDRAYLESHPEVLDHIIAYTTENLTVSTAGLIAEIACFTSPQEIDLRSITAPISLWHGTHDSVSKLGHLRQSISGLNYQERLFEGWGSMLMYRYWPDIVAHLGTTVE